MRDSIFFKTKRHDELAEKMANEEVADGEDEDNVFAAALVERNVDETSLESRQVCIFSQLIEFVRERRG